MKQLVSAEAGLSAQLKQLTVMAGHLPDAKKGPFIGRLRSYSSLGATQRQMLVDYLFQQLEAAGTLDIAGKAWDHAQATGVNAPVVMQTAQIARDKVMATTAAIKAANKANKLQRIILALAALAAQADVETIDEIVSISNDELARLVGQLSNDDYAALAPFLSLPKRG